MNKETLRRRLAPILNFGANPTRNLILLLSGFGITLLGLGLVLAAQYMFGNSMTQEVIAAGGVVLIGLGLCIAAIGYLCLSVISLIRYILHDPNSKTETTNRGSTSSVTKKDAHSPSEPHDQSESR